MAEDERKTVQDAEAAENGEAAADGGANGAQRAEGGDPTQRVAELEAALDAANARAEENWNQFLRARAELENVRRRLQRDVEHARKYGLEKFAAELLPVKDSLEMGLQAAEEGGDLGKLTEGTELTLKMLGQVLDRFQITAVDPAGEKFDPERHEAMAMQASEEHAPNTVIQVVQKGYALNDRLLRPAMVVVAKAPEGESGG